MKKLTILVLLAALTGIQACGQKGPLEVERTQVQQERDKSDTR